MLEDKTLLFLNNNIGLVFSYSEILYLHSFDEKNELSVVLEEIEESKVSFTEITTAYRKLLT